MVLSTFFLIIFPIFMVLTVGLLGRVRRIGFWGAIILSVLLTPVVGFLVALISGPKKIVIEDEDG